jgi:hypothetical protein
MRAWVYIALSALVVAFAVTWMTIPSGARHGSYVVGSPGFPASVFARGLTGTRSGGYLQPERISVFDRRALQERVLIVYGSAAVVILLIGAATRRRASLPERS